MTAHRTLVTGAGGMLGSAICPLFSVKSAAFLATDKIVRDCDTWMESLDVRDDRALSWVFREFQPSLVLHLAAETDLEFCETNRDVSFATNADATRTVAEFAEAAEATLVYVSTAGVFDGKKADPYTEGDTPHPINVYGDAKFQGEEHVRSLCRRHFIIRAGWMVGGGPTRDKKFVRKILAQLA